MSRVRLKYSGVVVFSSKILSLFTGLLFVLIAARKLSPEDYGLWSALAAFTSYFVLPSDLFTYWVARDVSRSFQVVKSASWLVAATSTCCFVAFLLLLPLTALSFRSTIFLLSLFALQIPLLHAMRLLETIGYSVKPQALSYGVAAFEVVKVFSCAALVLAFKQGLEGVVASVTIAQLAQAVVLLLALSSAIHDLWGTFNVSTVKGWLSKVWIPLYGRLNDIPYRLTLIVPVLWLGSTYPVALMTVPREISNIITYTYFLSVALTPRLLSGIGSGRDVEESLKLVLMASIPAVIGASILAKPLLQLLRPEYVAAAPILIVLSLGELLKVMASVWGSAIMGVEKVELNEKAKLRDYLKSKHFLMPTLSLVISVASLILLCLMILIAKCVAFNHEQLVFAYFSSMLLTIYLPAQAYLWLLARRSIAFKFPTKSVCKYLVASAVMALSVVVTYPSTAFDHHGALETAITILPTITVGSASYVLTLMAIDAEARYFVLLAIKTLRRTLQLRF